MINSSVFKRNFLIFSLIVTLFFLLSITFNWINRDVQRDKMKQISPFPIVISELLNEIDPDPILAVKKISKNKILSNIENIDVVNKDGLSQLHQSQIFSTPLSSEELNINPKQKKTNS